MNTSFALVHLDDDSVVLYGVCFVGSDSRETTPAPNLLAKHSSKDVVHMAGSSSLDENIGSSQQAEDADNEGEGRSYGIFPCAS